MRISLFFIAIILLSSACSTPKYTASFNYIQNQEERNNSAVQVTPATEVSSYNSEPVLASTSPVTSEVKVTSNAAPKELINIDKKEKKEAIKKLRSDVKTYIKEQKRHVHESSYQDFEWDDDLKLAAIFGAAGLVGVLLGGISVVFSIIGGAALIIAVIFFVQWVIRQ
jgi:Flp pilus assembly protein TadB